MTELSNLNALRMEPTTGLVDGDSRYLKGHTAPADGGGGVFMWRLGPAFTGLGIYSADNSGTVIKTDFSIDPNPFGRWVRQYDGYVSVIYFGAFGYGNDYNSEVQAAIDFAAKNTADNPLLKSSVVYIPNGSYVLSKITLRNGVDILGDSLNKTNIYTAKGSINTYLFSIEEGPVVINISNLNIIGQNPSRDNEDTDMGCFYFNGHGLSPDQIPYGGLFNSTLRNIQIRRFRGEGIYLKGGGGKYSYYPNQFNVFENVRVFKYNNDEFTHVTNALRMQGENGQHTFINCQFDGHSRTGQHGERYFDKWANVYIENDGLSTSNAVSFMTCTFQDSDYGVVINFGENITLDGCWFESLGVAIAVNGKYKPSTSINILNSRFANAAGFGSINPPNNITDGQCVSVNNSVVNVYNNYVTASFPDNVNPNSAFVLGAGGNQGINLYANTFFRNNKKLSKTFGVMQTVSIDVSDTIDCKSNRLVYVGLEAPHFTGAISRIESSINAGEVLTVHALADITFYDTGNIFLTNRASFNLAPGEIAGFIKVDVGTDNETFQLASFVKTTP